MNIFYQLKDLIIRYSNANINYTLSFFLHFILFFLITRGIWYIHLVHCLVFVCFILYQFSFSYFYLVTVVNVYYQEHTKKNKQRKTKNRSLKWWEKSSSSRKIYVHQLLCKWAILPWSTKIWHKTQGTWGSGTSFHVCHTIAKLKIVFRRETRVG